MSDTTTKASFRYYVSFSFQAPTGLGILAIDITVLTRIVGADDIARIREHLSHQGYKNATVLAFSLYPRDSHPTPAPRATPPIHRRGRST